MKNPELLLPAGNIESFYAALEGGADAVYLGLKHFNARERAFNFSIRQIPVLLDLARKKNAKVYITLNTVVKNKELPDLLNVLDGLDQVKPDAVIIQDWGVYYLIKKHFSSLHLHASTQMANHNSTGAEYSRIKGFKRVILARELTLKEAENINQKSTIETETFIHGALCYSFSGMCHFSSYINANGANRGLCSQICRRSFDKGDESQFFFSLKDQQQIEHIPALIEAGVRSFKVEGRLKSADYVYQVARAYRMVIDSPDKLPLALGILESETGRAKTGYFLGNDLSDAFTGDDSGTGIYLGNVKNSDYRGFEFESSVQFESGFRLRIVTGKNEAPIALNVNEYSQKSRNITVKTTISVPVEGRVYLIGSNAVKFSSRLPSNKKEMRLAMLPEQKRGVLNSLVVSKRNTSGGLFIRIDTPEFLKKLNLDYTDQCILAFSRKDLENFNPDEIIAEAGKHKIWIELPRFIPEGMIEAYTEIAAKLSEMGYNRFFLSHAYQKLMLPKNSVFAFNENVYVYNDASALFAETESARYFTYPVENDGMNLESFRNKSGIVPIYFYPKLFISRMPVKIKEDEIFEDKSGNKFKKFVIDGISYTIPEIPVSLTHRVNQLKQQGFGNFLLDLSFENPLSKRFKTIIKKYFNSEQIQPASTFNFKRELK
jgi:putative protease